MVLGMTLAVVAALFAEVVNVNKKKGSCWHLKDVCSCLSFLYSFMIVFY